MTDDWVTAPADHGTAPPADHGAAADDWVTHNPPAPGSRENPLDDIKHAADAGTIARASLPPDEKVQIQRYAESFNQPPSDFGVVNGHIVRKLPGTDQYARVQASVRGATGPIDAAQRAMDWVASGAGPAMPAAASVAGAAVAALAATPETLGAGALPAAMTGGALGASAGELARQKLDHMLAPKGDKTEYDMGNVGWQAAAGAAGPVVGKVVEALAPVAGRVATQIGKAGAAADMAGAGVGDAAEQSAVRGGADAASPSVKDLGLSQAGLAALKRQAEAHRAEIDLLTKDIAAFGEAGAPVDLSLGQKTGSVVLQQKERQMIRDPETAQDVVDLRKLQNETQLPGAVRNVLDDVSPTQGREDAIGSFRTGADAVVKAEEKARADAAAPDYKSAFSANRSMASPAIDKLLDTPEGNDAFKYAIRRMQNRMRNVGTSSPELTQQLNDLVARSEMKPAEGGVAPGLNLETLDLIKQGMWDSEEALRKRVLNGNARQGEVDEAESIRRAFTNELDRLDVTANQQAQGLPIQDMQAAIRKASKGGLPKSQIDGIIANVDDMIKEAGGATEVLDSYKFPKGQEDFYKAALSVAEDHAAGPPTTGGNGLGLYKKARTTFGDQSEDLDAMKQGGIGYIQRMNGQDRQNIVSRVFSGGALLPEEIARMREQFAVAGKLADWNAGVRAHIEEKLAQALQPTQGGEVSNVGGKLYQGLFAPESADAKVLRAALGSDGDAVMKRWDSLGRVMRAAAHQLAEGSASITDLQAQSTMKRLAFGLKLIMNPQGIPGEALDKMAVSEKGDVARQFARYALTPEGDKILRALQLQTPSSPKAQTLLAKLITQAGVVEGAGSAARSDDK